MASKYLVSFFQDPQLREHGHGHLDGVDPPPHIAGSLGHHVVDVGLDFLNAIGCGSMLYRSI